MPDTGTGSVCNPSPWAMAIKGNNHRRGLIFAALQLHNLPAWRKRVSWGCESNETVWGSEGDARLCVNGKALCLPAAYRHHWHCLLLYPATQPSLPPTPVHIKTGWYKHYSSMHVHIPAWGSSGLWRFKDFPLWVTAVLIAGIRQQIYTDDNKQHGWLDLREAIAECLVGCLQCVHTRDFLHVTGRTDPHTFCLIFVSCRCHFPHDSVVCRLHFCRM